MPDTSDTPVPDGVSIDEDTGLMTVAGWVAAGTYYFEIRANNQFGQDQQTFMLVVKNRIISGLRYQEIFDDLSITPLSMAMNRDPSNLDMPVNRNDLNITSLSAIQMDEKTNISAIHVDEISNLSDVQMDEITSLSDIQVNKSSWIKDLTDTPEYILRNDDPKDLYSQDMLFISGAAYVKYDLEIAFNVEGDNYLLREYDNSPCNNHHGMPMNEEEKKAIEDYFKNRKLFIEYDRFGFGPDIASRLDINIVDDYMDYAVFDYGHVLDVYKYDAGSQQFAIIAEHVTVAEGGVVSYKNNTMSEYLITTAKLKQAVKTDAYEVNHPSTNKRSGNWLIYAVGAFMVMLIAGVLILLVIHKMKLRKIHKSSPTSP